MSIVLAVSWAVVLAVGLAVLFVTWRREGRTSATGVCLVALAIGRAIGWTIYYLLQDWDLAGGWTPLGVISAIFALLTAVLTAALTFGLDALLVVGSILSVLLAVFCLMENRIGRARTVELTWWLFGAGMYGGIALVLVSVMGEIVPRGGMSLRGFGTGLFAGLAVAMVFGSILGESGVGPRWRRVCELVALMIAGSPVWLLVDFVARRGVREDSMLAGLAESWAGVSLDGMLLAGLGGLVGVGAGGLIWRVIEGSSTNTCRQSAPEILTEPVPNPGMGKDDPSRLA